MNSASVPTQAVRRSSTRLRYGLAIGCRANDGRSWSARALNLSPEGCRVVYWSDDPWPSLVELSLRSSDGKDVFVQAQVKSVQQCGKLWLLDCHFVRHLTVPELEAIRASDHQE
jgi:hypothetical protein